MIGHEATWVHAPDFKSGQVGQYYCARCKLELDVAYNQNRENESCTGWYWEIRDHGDYGRSGSAGTKHVATYEPDIHALDEVKREGLARFDSFPCLRSN
jgi:hypothetical protein